MNRRRFLSRSALTLGGAAVGLESRAAPGEDYALVPPEAYAPVTDDATAAVKDGLKYLARTQNRDGSFGEFGVVAGNVAVTSLATLAFMAGGHQPGRGEYGSNVTRALRYVLSCEQAKPAGYFHVPRGAFQQTGMYSHGFGTLMLAECYGMVPDAALQTKLKGAVERAVQLIVSTQNSEGGWRYEPKRELADVSVTICQIMALRAARNAGFFVPKEVVDKCVKYVRACQVKDGGFSYMNSPGASAFPRSAAGVVALYCAGVYSGPEIDKGLDYLMKAKPPTPRFLAPQDSHYYYAHYYAAQAMWTAGGKYWAQWFPAIRDELLAGRRDKTTGGWTDLGVCNHYGTAMACIILQIPNNYLPILQK